MLHEVNENTGRFSSQLHADADLPDPLIDGEGHHSKKTDRGEEQGDPCETSDEHGRQSLDRHCFLNNFSHEPVSNQRLFGIDFVHHASNGLCSLSRLQRCAGHYGHERLGELGIGQIKTRLDILAHFLMPNIPDDSDNLMPDKIAIRIQLISGKTLPQRAHPAIAPVPLSR